MGEDLMGEDLMGEDPKAAWIGKAGWTVSQANHTRN
jgi:hypothetical protein